MLPTSTQTTISVLARHTKVRVAAGNGLVEGQLVFMEGDQERHLVLRSRLVLQQLQCKLLDCMKNSVCLFRI
jgi:hypothetical protein